MGLKVRRLKYGFAYYAEYKFGSRCVYEKINAGSSREARKIYSARYKELREQIPRMETGKPLTPRQARDSQINTVLAGLLHTMIKRGFLSDAELHDLLNTAFRQVDRDEGIPSSAASTTRVYESMRRDLLAGLSELSSHAVDANADRVDLVPS